MKARVRERSVLAVVTATVSTAIIATAGCTPGPLSTPHVGGPMGQAVPLSSSDTTGGLESMRRQLTGTWDLVSLEVLPPRGGARVPVNASGTLRYDEYGNLTIDARTTDPAAPIAAREQRQLSFSGRAVIDVAKSELKLMDMTGNVNPDEVLAPERRRRMAWNNDLLTLTSFDEQDQTTAVATWRRR